MQTLCELQYSNSCSTPRKAAWSYPRYHGSRKKVLIGASGDPLPNTPKHIPGGATTDLIAYFSPISGEDEIHSAFTNTRFGRPLQMAWIAFASSTVPLEK